MILHVSNDLDQTWMRSILIILFAAQRVGVLVYHIAVVGKVDIETTLGILL